MRTRNKDNFCVILAGGKGRRLWPCSREDMPKQFVDFFSTGRTLLQQTFDRMSKLIPMENIYVNTNNVYAHFVEEQLPEILLGNILSEPIFRNTAPSAAWATYRIYHKNSSARIVVTPSDMAVFNEEAFLDNIGCAQDWYRSPAGLTKLAYRLLLYSPSPAVSGANPLAYSLLHLAPPIASPRRILYAYRPDQRPPNGSINLCVPPIRPRSRHISIHQRELCLPRYGYAHRGYHHECRL